MCSCHTKKSYMKVYDLPLVTLQSKGVLSRKHCNSPSTRHHHRAYAHKQVRCDIVPQSFSLHIQLSHSLAIMYTRIFPLYTQQLYPAHINHVTVYTLLWRPPVAWTKSLTTPNNNYVSCSPPKLFVYVSPHCVCDLSLMKAHRLGQNVW